jgi:hypothetical protein
MLIVKRLGQTGKGTENVIVIGKEIEKLWKRGLQVGISGSLETGGNDILLRPMRGIGLYDVILGKFP